jgi:DNA-binding transcriptional LysR family regulator
MHISLTFDVFFAYMNLKRLRHFVVLSEIGNFSRAARQVHLSQPALSRSIQLLEQECGAALFDRDRKGVALTAAGHLVAERARRILLETGSLTQELAQLQRYQLGGCTFGAGPHPAAALVPQLLARAIGAYPDLKVNVEIAQPEHLLEQLRTERLDFFIAATDGLALDDTIDVRPLPSPTLACFVAAGHPLLKKKKWPKERLLDFPWAATRTTSEIRDMLFADVAVSSQRSLLPAITCEDLFILVKVALQTQAILVAPHSAVADELAAKRLVALPLEAALFEKPEFGVVRLARRTPSPAAALLMELVKADSDSAHYAGRTPDTPR